MLVVRNGGGVHEVCRYDVASGALLGTFGRETEAYGSMTSGDGKEVLVVSNVLGAYTLQRFAADGTYRGDLAGSWLGGLAGAKRGPDGAIYAIVQEVAGWDWTGRANVMRIDRENGAAAEVATFVVHGSGGMQAPVAFVFGPEKDLYVADAAVGILRFDGKTGERRGVFVPLGQGGLTDVAALAFGPDDRLYVASRSANGVLRYDGASGAFVDQFVPYGSGGLVRPAGLAFGPEADLYVTSAGTGQVLRYDGETGAFLQVATTAAPVNPYAVLGDVVFTKASRPKR